MNTNKVIEIEGEIDEEEFQENLENLNIQNKNKTQPETKISENNTISNIDYSKLETIEQMVKTIQNYYSKELNSSMMFCENLS